MVGFFIPAEWQGKTPIPSLFLDHFPQTLRDVRAMNPINPFACALSAFHSGDLSAAFVIRRDDGFQQQVPASIFFSDDDFPSLESLALDLCEGRILDIGGAAGRHSLELIRRGLAVTSLDILPDMEVILRDRGVDQIVISDVFTFSGVRFDTLLMLMNGIGMVGIPGGLDRFLQHAHQIIRPGGQIICDSIDVSVTSDPAHAAYRQRNLKLGRPPGQQTFTMTYKTVTGEPFDWLHIDFASLSDHCGGVDWHATLISQEPSGHYLCRLTETCG
jgi:SAM-dependent methyltransferase